MHVLTGKSLKVTAGLNIMLVVILTTSQSHTLIQSLHTLGFVDAGKCLFGLLGPQIVELLAWEIEDLLFSF